MKFMNQGEETQKLVLRDNLSQFDILLLNVALNQQIRLKKCQFYQIQIVGKLVVYIFYIFYTSCEMVLQCSVQRRNYGQEKQEMMCLKTTCLYLIHVLQSFMIQYIITELRLRETINDLYQAIVFLNCFLNFFGIKRNIKILWTPLSQECYKFYTMQLFIATCIIETYLLYVLQSFIFNEDCEMYQSFNSQEKFKCR
eukprot:TRINITY_DN3442_c0_g1_i17.p1 TRINITY_DN3442_c0_g1~~TRINITY_DN3442_c0_g1_i17.p1  ORF type:complete len:197 (-),score=-8.92 TRINITY_DN3442_c0_g1_i17:237-827(-)